MHSRLVRLSKLTLSNPKTDLSVRLYSRWAHRRPARVLSSDNQEILSSKYENEPENIIELTSDEVQVSGREKRPKSQHKSILGKLKPKTQLFDLSRIDSDTKFVKEVTRKADKVRYTSNEILRTTFDANGEFVYEKMRDNDSKIGALMLMVKSRKLRDRKNSILIEGKRLIKDALLAKCTIEHLLFSRKSDLEFIKALLPKKDLHLYKMAYKDMQMWSDLTTSPGVMGIFKTPNLENQLSNPNKIPLTIICDNIREPGNLGAILRSSVAVGAQKIILTKGCVDLWETKVLRSSSGAHFRLPIHKNQDWSEIRAQMPENVAVFLADNNLGASEHESGEILEDLARNVPILPYFSVNFPQNKANVLIIGGETLGLSENAFRFTHENKGVRLNIPLNNHVESLNTGTALGIIVFEIKRQFLIQK